MPKIAVGVRVFDHVCYDEWATIKEVRADGRFTVDWDDGTVGAEWWDAKAWSFDRTDDPRAPTGPVRTETVTTRRIEPGVYGLLNVGITLGGTEPRVGIALGHDISMHGNERPASAPQLRELARVALELAEYLDAQ